MDMHLKSKKGISIPSMLPKEKKSATFLYEEKQYINHFIAKNKIVMIKRSKTTKIIHMFFFVFF